MGQVDYLIKQFSFFYSPTSNYSKLILKNFRAKKYVILLIIVCVETLTSWWE